LHKLPAPFHRLANGFVRFPPTLLALSAAKFGGSATSALEGASLMAAPVCAHDGGSTTDHLVKSIVFRIFRRCVGRIGACREEDTNYLGMPLFHGNSQCGFTLAVFCLDIIHCWY
jgi:hypothetical protein